MALINRPLGPRNYEIIRDRIGQILAVELLRQEAITYDELFDVPVFVQRSKPVNQDEPKVICVSFDTGTFSSQTVISANGEMTFFIDVILTGKSTQDGRGDVLTAHTVQRLAGVCVAILEDPQYVTLGFERPFIGRSHVTEVAPGTIERGEATELSVVRITLNVLCLQKEPGITGVDFLQNLTVVTLQGTEFGFQYVGGANVTPIPPIPTCAPVKIFKDDILFDTINSGGSFYFYSEDDADWVLKNTLGEDLDSGTIVSGGSAIITAPNAIAENSNGSFSVEIPSGNTESLPDVTISIIDQFDNPWGSEVIPSAIDATIQVNIPPSNLDVQVMSLSIVQETFSINTTIDNTIIVTL